MSTIEYRLRYAAETLMSREIHRDLLINLLLEAARELDTADARDSARLRWLMQQTGATREGIDAALREQEERK